MDKLKTVPISMLVKATAKIGLQTFRMWLLSEELQRVRAQRNDLMEAINNIRTATSAQDEYNAIIRSFDVVDRINIAVAAETGPDNIERE